MFGGSGCHFGVTVTLGLRVCLRRQSPLEGFLADFWPIFRTKNRSHEWGPKPAKHRPMFGGFLPSFVNATDCTIWEMGLLVRDGGQFLGNFWWIFGGFFLHKNRSHEWGQGVIFGVIVMRWSGGLAGGSRNFRAILMRIFCHIVCSQSKVIY